MNDSPMKDTNTISILMLAVASGLSAIAMIRAREWWHLWFGLALLVVILIGSVVYGQARHRRRFGAKPFGPRRFALRIGMMGTSSLHRFRNDSLYLSLGHSVGITLYAFRC